MLNIDPRWGSWADAPAAMKPDEASETLGADVVILGAGMAGVACALRAAQMGAKVLVLEKSSGWSGRGGNIGVANSSFMKDNGIENDIDEVAREWVKRCGNRCDEKILRLFLKNGGRAMDWLVDIITQPDYGARPALQGCMYKGETYLELAGSHRFFGGPMEKKGMRAGGADAVFAMYSEAVKLGAGFLFNVVAEQLLKEDGGVTGVFGRRADGSIVLAKGRRGVVIATGDIGGNHAMCEDLAPMANRCALKIYSPKDGNNGDGHRMGLWAGGSFEETPFPMVLHPMAFHYSNYCFLFVKPDGTRFMNEDSYVQGKSVAVLRERTQFAWSIADSQWRQKVPPTLENGGGMFWGHDCEIGQPGFDPEYEQGVFERGLERGVVVTADTPEGLAEKMGVPAAAFAATLARYNELASLGRDEDFGKRREQLVAIDKPPYFGMKFGPALLAVVGGLRVDTQMRVLDGNSAPVGGLFAIGNAAGGRYGVDYPMLIAGNSHGTALTFGFLLGEQF